jgi:hypothetical protein
MEIACLGRFIAILLLRALASHRVAAGAALTQSARHVPFGQRFSNPLQTLSAVNAPGKFGEGFQHLWRQNFAA